MQTLTTRRIIIASLVFSFLTLATLYQVDHFGKSNRVSAATGSIKAQSIVKKLVENPRDAYKIWKEAGYRGRTIVFVADRWESFDPGELIPAQLFRAYPLQLYNTAARLESEHLNGVTLLYVASMNNIIRTIVAIMPESEVGRLAVASRTSKDARVSGKGVFVSRQGLPRWYTTGANYTYAGEPVLLYIGASYFKTVEPELLYQQLLSSGLQTDCVILCNEKGKDGVTTTEVVKLNRFARLIGMSL